MMQYEAVSTTQFTVGTKDENALKYAYEMKKREVEWMKKHGIDHELVHPDWAPEKTKQMYKLGKRRPKPEPPAPEPIVPIESIEPEAVSESESEAESVPETPVI